MCTKIGAFRTVYVNSCAYKVLQVPCSAVQTDIDNAYSKLHRTEDPSNDGDLDKWVAIELAYSLLGDPEQRFRYDAYMLARESDAGLVEFRGRWKAYVVMDLPVPASPAVTSEGRP